MATMVNIDGEILAPDAARVSVFDRGFLYGDSVYEVVRTYGGRPFALEAHLARLAGSAQRIGLELPWDLDRWREQLARTLEAAGNAAEGRETYLRIVVSRGAGEIGLDPALADAPKVVIIAQEMHPPPPEAWRDGVEVAIVHVQRNAPAAVDPSAKTGNYLNNVMALREARSRGAFEAVMLDGRGRIAEGSTSNVFMVKDGRVKTPSLETGILRGVTREHVLAVAGEAGVPVDACACTPGDLRGADEAFITGTIKEVVPVVRVDGTPVGDGRPGPVTRRIQAGFRAHTGDPFPGAGF